MERLMSKRLYEAAAAGDQKVFEEGNEEVNVLSWTHEANNCLHIAARFGRENFVQIVINLCPSLIYQQNSRGDNPLHIAARAGHLGVVKLLTDSFQQQFQSPQSTGSTGNRATARGGILSEGRSPREAEEGEDASIKNHKNITGPTDSVQPPRSSQSQSTGVSATAGNDTTSERSLKEAEEGERPSSPIWTIQSQQNISTTLTDSGPPPSYQSESRAGNIVHEEVTITSSERPSVPIWRTQNHYDGSTALHEALRNKHEDVALHLLDLDSAEVVLVVNAKSESPLYLAAEAGYVPVVNKILQAGGHRNTAGPNHQTPFHAAVFAESAESIEILHQSIRGLIRKRDSNGKTALYHAIQLKSLEILRLLLKLDASSAYICDNEGLSPLLVAAICSSEAVRAMLDACPASIEALDGKGRNALHLSVMHNSARRFRILLGMPEMEALINEPDKEGDTPLHLATMGHKYKHVRSLLSTKCVDLTAKNNVGQTALDLCEMDWELSARQKRIWKLLRRVKATTGRGRPLMKLTFRSRHQISTRASVENLKQVANTLAVVAALLATITFAAAFTIPGGYKSTDGPNVGSPTLVHKPALLVFLFSDTIALCCSMAALLLLIRATASDKSYLRSMIGSSIALVNVALYLAMVAFFSGLCAVLSIESTWVPILLCIVGSSFIVLHRMARGSASSYTPLVPGLLRQDPRYLEP